MAEPTLCQLYDKVQHKESFQKSVAHNIALYQASIGMQNQM